MNRQQQSFLLREQSGPRLPKSHTQPTCLLESYIKNVKI